MMAATGAIVLMAGACRSSKKSSTSGTTAATGAAGATTPTTASGGTPQVGGTLTFGEYSQPAGLDPIVSTGQGTTGAIEMTAVYDTLLAYNKTTATYYPRLALSATPNADFTQWTVKLRPNVKFTDGTDYNAAAVVEGMNRHRSGSATATADGVQCAAIVACPRNTTSSGVYMALVKNITAVDPLTVSFTLTQPWSGFRYALSAEPSMIPSPTALAKCDGTKAPSMCAFNLKPVGAGPFMVSTFAPHDSITMVRNPNYWGGPAYLDGMKFVDLGDAGSDKTFQALQGGALQAAFLRAPSAVSAAHAANYAGTSTLEYSGGQLLLNNGATVVCASQKPAPTCTGKPDGPTKTTPATADLRVRQAVAAAVDPKVLDARGNDGKGIPTSDLLPPSFKWYPGIEGPKYDPTAAKALVAAAKASGWDGKIRLEFNSSPVAMATGLAVQAELTAVGMNPTLDTSKDVTGQVVQIVTTKDFDLSTWGIALSGDDGAVPALAQNLASTSASNRVGFSDPLVDQALNALFAASTDAQKVAAYKTIATEVYAKLPFFIWSTVEEFTAWGPKVHGIVGTDRSSVLFDKAWIEK
jgi:peptide/nickel transport system substrate-binding protein